MIYGHFIPTVIGDLHTADNTYSISFGLRGRVSLEWIYVPSPKLRPVVTICDETL